MTQSKTPKADALRQLRERGALDREAQQKRIASAARAAKRIEQRTKPKRRRSRPGSTEPG